MKTTDPSEPTCQGCTRIQKQLIHGITYLHCPVWNFYVSNDTPACGDKTIRKGEETF